MDIICVGVSDVPSQSADEVAARGDLFTRGRWRELTESALRVEAPVSETRTVDRSSTKGASSTGQSSKGQVSRALAPKTKETLTELRKRRPQVQLSETQEVRQFVPESPLHLDLEIFCLDDHETLLLVGVPATDFTNGDSWPEEGRRSQESRHRHHFPGIDG